MRVSPWFILLVFWPIRFILLVFWPIRFIPRGAQQKCGQPDVYSTSNSNSNIIVAPVGTSYGLVDS